MPRREPEDIFATFVRNKLGMIGLFGVVLILVIGIVGPMFIPYPSGYATDTSLTYLPPSSEHWLGTDNWGWMCSRRSYGARVLQYMSQ